MTNYSGDRLLPPPDPEQDEAYIENGKMTRS